MNIFTLVCKLKTVPELRYTPSDQKPITSFGVDFADPNPEKTETFPLRVTLFGKGAEAVVNMGLTIGEPLLVEGRLKMDLLDRPEGFKEKRGEVLCNRLQRLQLPSATPNPAPAQTMPVQQVPVTPVAAPVPTPAPAPAPTPAPQTAPVSTVPGTVAADPFADIPF